MFLQNKILGAIGEQFAVAYIEKKGFKVIDRNFRAHGGEIDIVAIDYSEGKTYETLVFIEVKTRSTANYGDPIEAIGYYKMRALTRTANYYKLLHKNVPDLMRIDAVLVLVDEMKQLNKIELVKNIFS